MPHYRLEAILSQWFRAQVKHRWPDAFVYKIPDTFNLGGLKPFDCIIQVAGHAFAIEFKRGGTMKATPYQSHHLAQFRHNGGHGWVVNEKNKTPKLKAMEAIVNG